jgi:hypothetical protein
MAGLTEAQIKLEQERLQLIQDQNTAAKDLASTYEKMRKSSIGLNSDEKESLDISKQIAKQSDLIASSINKRVSGTSTIKELEKTLNQLKFNAIDAEKNLQKLLISKQNALAKIDIFAKRENVYKNKLNQELDRQQAIQDRIEEIKRSAGGIDQKALVKAREELKSSKGALDNLEKSLRKTTQIKDEQKNIFKQLEETIKANEITAEQQQKEQNLLKQAIVEKKKEGVLDEVKKRLRIDEIKEMFTLAGILKIIINAALRFNATSVEIGKNIGYGADQADRVAQNLTQIANNSNDLNITLKALGAAMSELNDATGGVAEYSADVLKTQVMLTKQFGLTGEEAAGIYKYSVLTGKASSQVNDEMVAAFANTRNAVKGSANFKKTMAEAAKVSGELAVNLKNNPAAITSAIVKAQILGTTLEQAKNQGKALLDFESSISNELEAELMTGQQLNLEKARMFALTGDMVGLSQELANQGMTLNKFENMNVLARESYSKALGLNSDQLSDQLRKQKIAQEQGKSLAEITKEEALEAEKRQNIQDKFNAAIEKLQDFIGNLVAGPLGSMLDILSQSLDVVNLILMPFQALYNLTSMVGQAIFGWVDKLGVVGKILKGIAGIAILYAAYSAYGALAGIPIVGPILGGIAAAAITAAGFGLLNTQKAGDMISPADGKTQVSTKEGGLFELSPNDDLLAGPGLAKGGGGNKGESIQSNVSIDLTPLIIAMNSVKASIDKLYAKEGVVNIDGKKVGTLLTQGTYKTA